MIEAGDNRNAILLSLRLANELEDNMDFAMFYSSASRKKLRNDAYYDACIQLAKSLQLNFIAQQLNYWLKSASPDNDSIRFR